MLQNFWLSLLSVPIEFRVAWFAVVGACIGSFLNVCVVRFPNASEALLDQYRAILGTSRCQACGESVRWYHNLPIVSWFWLRGQCALCGKRFSVRYMLVEAFTAAVFGGLYYWWVELNGAGGLLPATIVPVPSPLQMHLFYLAHMLLFCLLLAAALIDVDTWIIPDGVTVTGTLVGLTLSTLCTWRPPLGPAVSPLLPNWAFGNSALQDFVCWMPSGSLSTVPAWSWGFPSVESLWIALACLVGWCLALLPWKWYFRWGLKWTFRILIGRLTAWRFVGPIYAMAVVGSGLVTLVWYFWGQTLHWQGLFTSLVGMAAGGGGVWALRIIGRQALGKEAMGFGDVTLMAMIGSFLGWQACLILFFMAAFYGLAAAIIQLVVWQKGSLPYGPSLCLAAATTVVRWDPVWNYFGPLFLMMGAFLPFILLVVLMFSGVLLFFMRLIRLAFEAVLGGGGKETEEEDEDEEEDGDEAEEAAAEPLADAEAEDEGSAA